MDGRGLLFSTNKTILDMDVIQGSDRVRTLVLEANRLMQYLEEREREAKETKKKREQLLSANIKKAVAAQDTQQIELLSATWLREGYPVEALDAALVLPVPEKGPQTALLDRAGMKKYAEKMGVTLEDDDIIRIINHIGISESGPVPVMKFTRLLSAKQGGDPNWINRGSQKRNFAKVGTGVNK